MATEYRYLRWLVTDFYDNGFYYFLIEELEAMEAGAPSTDICTGGSAYSSLNPQTSSWLTAYAFNNASTGFASYTLNQFQSMTYAQMQPWVEYDLGSGVTAQPNKYTIKARSSSVLQYPKAWQFMLSNDRFKWVVANEQSGITFSTLGEIKTFTFNWSTVSGNVKASGVNQTSRPVVILKNSDFSYLGEGVTDGNGDYAIDVPFQGDVLVVCKGASGQRPAAHTVTTT